jgi:hypothetical protein
MKKVVLTLASAVALNGLMTAQNRVVNSTSISENLKFDLLNTSNFKPSSTCYDTLMNFSSTPLYVYRAGATGTNGYIAGTNNFNDLEKAEFFAASTYTNISNPLVNAVYVFFYRDPSGTMGTMGNPNTPVDLIIYDGDGINGPSTPAGTFTATIGSIVAAATPTSVAILYMYSGSPISIPNPTVGFFASVQIPDGTVAGDTAVIFSASVTNNTAWEKWSDNSWHTFVGGWNVKMSLAIIPVISGSCVTTAVGNNYDLNQAVNILPNPSTTGKIYLTGAFPTEQNIKVEVLNVLGQVILRKESNFKVGFVQLDMENFENGIYFVNVSNGNQNITRRIVINK